MSASVLRTLGFFLVTLVTVTVAYLWTHAGLSGVAEALVPSALFGLAFAAGEVLRTLVAPTSAPATGHALRRGAVVAVLTWGTLGCAWLLAPLGLRDQLANSSFVAQVLGCGLAGVLAAGLRAFTGGEPASAPTAGR